MDENYWRELAETRRRRVNALAILLAIVTGWLVFTSGLDLYVRFFRGHQ